MILFLTRSVHIFFSFSFFSSCFWTVEQCDSSHAPSIDFPSIDFSIHRFSDSGSWGLGLIPADFERQRSITEPFPSTPTEVCEKSLSLCLWFMLLHFSEFGLNRLELFILPVQTQRYTPPLKHTADGCFVEWVVVWPCLHWFPLFWGGTAV